MSVVAASNNYQVLVKVKIIIHYHSFPKKYSGVCYSEGRSILWAVCGLANKWSCLVISKPYRHALVVLQIGAGASSDYRKRKLAIFLARTGCQRYYYARQSRPEAYPRADKGGLLPRRFSGLLLFVFRFRSYLIPPIMRLELYGRSERH